MAEQTLQHPLTARFIDALTFACDLHRTQTRKGTQIPYVSHLLAVAKDEFCSDACRKAQLAEWTEPR